MMEITFHYFNIIIYFFLKKKKKKKNNNIKKKKKKKKKKIITYLKKKSHNFFLNRRKNIIRNQLLHPTFYRLKLIQTSKIHLVIRVIFDLFKIAQQKTKGTFSNLSKEIELATY